MSDVNIPLPRSEEEYLATRVPDQINWFDGKSAKNKANYHGLKVTEIILALFIPFLAGYIDADDSPLKLVIGVLGVAVAAITGIITLKKFQENWIEYRTTAEALKLEKHLFLAKTGPYKDQNDPYPFFVDRFEDIIAKSTKKWVSYNVGDSNKGKVKKGK